MNPDRLAMLEGRKSSHRRDATGPTRDSNNRISKFSKPSRPAPATASKATARANYFSQDEQSAKFVADEDSFVLKQAKKKADIRVRERRATPIDYLAFNLRFVDTDRDLFEDDDADVDIAVPDPTHLIDGLGLVQLKELEADVESYKTLEVSGRNREYWAALLELCREKRRTLTPANVAERSVNNVAGAVSQILEPKTYEQLDALEKQVKAKLGVGGAVDTDYWEQILDNMSIYKAKAKLNKICQEIKAARQALLKDRGPSRVDVEQPGRQKKTLDARPEMPSLPPVSLAMALTSTVESSAPPGTSRFSHAGDEDFSQATKALYEREVARGVNEDEEIFTAEESVPASSKPQWAGKYRARKPRYFNRVQMGYDWNKYNQTHYDHDNPPPKVVQGYKFNIFYPDLIDKTKAPTFKIIREGGRRRGESFAPAGEEDSCLIRFIAGPPYEDIAFRVVDREWDYSAKRERGFRSSFDKGILQLHFQFKKVYYRK